MCVGCLNLHPRSYCSPSLSLLHSTTVRANVLYYCCLPGWLLFCTGKRKRPIWLPYARILYVCLYLLHVSYAVAHCHHYECAFMVCQEVYSQRRRDAATTTCSISNWASCNGSSARKGVASGRQHSHVCACVCAIHHARTHVATHH